MDRVDYLNALRAFEAAARKLSYVEAARELNVTPAAIGQHVRALEQWLNTPLFQRSKSGARRLALTDKGQTLLPELSDGFMLIASAVERIRRADKTQSVTLAVTPAFATYWLLSRLDEIRSAYPTLSLKLEISDTLIDYRRHEVELGVRFGAGAWEGCASAKLADERVFPVCSPALAEDGAGLHALADLERHTLIHDTTVPAAAGAPTWRAWLDRAGASSLDVGGSLRVNASGTAIQAAVASQGIALARGLLVAGDIAAGRLVCPFPDQAWPVRWAWYLVWPQNAHSPKVDRVRAWLMAQANDQLSET